MLGQHGSAPLVLLGVNPQGGLRLAERSKVVKLDLGLLGPEALRG
jgi:hypothetical protein